VRRAFREPCRGLELAHSKFGRAQWADDVAPAIELASRGFEVSYSIAESLQGSRNLSQFPESKRIFQKDGVVLPRPATEWFSLNWPRRCVASR
jgi:gamma-glutamyltranspeptidase